MASELDEERRTELVRIERKRQHIQGLGLFTTSVGGTTLFASAVLAFLGEEPAADPRLLAVASAVGFVLAVFGVILVFRARPGAAAKELAAGLTRRDRMQRARTASFLTFPLSTVVLTLWSMKSGFDIRAGEGDGFDWLWVATTPLLCAAFPLAAAGLGYWGRSDVKKWLEDEFTPLLRGRAFQIGYFGLLAGAVALYLTALFRPEWVLLIGAVLLAPGLVLPPLWFAMLDRRSDPDE